MKKMNKKGFTLIEMLVVIAIIAVLVAIVVPTVSNSTVKAAAAANAANLRSYKATVTTAYLSNEITVDTDGKIAAATGFTLPTAPKSEKCGPVVDGTAATATYNTTTKEFDVKFGDNTIEMFAQTATDGKIDSLKATTVSK